ncbi:MAG: hypothetical protein JWN89_27 [Parcubacteria group bacterium]|nr:hypothetical protein [Parcubacteria group bacterium]
MRRYNLFLMVLFLGCSPERLSLPGDPSMFGSGAPVLKPRLPRPTPLWPIDSLVRKSPAASYLELLGRATTTPLHLTKMPLDPFGNDDYVHPDVILGPRGCGKKMIVTPYKGSNANFENPTFLCFLSQSWVPPSFMESPLVPHPGPNRYSSDPDMIYDPGFGETVITWREVDPVFNTIKALTTPDEVNIFHKGILFQERNHNAVSQTSVLEPDRSLWSMWYVQAGGGGCVASGTDVILREAVPIPGRSVTEAPLKVVGPVAIAQPGYVIWHIDVIRAEGFGYLMLAAAYPKGTDCGHCDLFLFVSRDRKNWENFAIPFLWRSMPQFKVKTLYRGSMLFDPLTEGLSMTISAMNTFGHWDILGDGEYKLGSLLSALRSTKAEDMPTISASKIGIDQPHTSKEKAFIAP